MGRNVTVRRPDGRAGSYSGWLAAEASRWNAATAAEQAESQAAARARHADLNKSRPKAQSSSATVLLVYDEIGYWGITAADLVADLMSISGDLELHLNTPGGDVWDGIAISNALKQRAGSVKVVVDGLAASIGSVIAMGASPGQLVMSPNATMMIHDAWGLCIGSAADMTGMAAQLDMASDNIADVYAARSGKPAADWRAVMQAESWMVGQEAVDAGLADSLGDVPATAQAAMTSGPVAGLRIIVNSVGRRQALGIESMPLPAAKAIGVHHTDTAETAWDGPAAVKGMPAEYGDLHYCHAWQSADADSSSHTPGDDDADDRKGNFKFPHHDHKGGPANIAACSNGLARLAGADIPDADRAGVEAHLRAHLKDGGHGDDAEDHADPWLDLSEDDIKSIGKSLEEAFN